MKGRKGTSDDTCIVLEPLSGSRVSGLAPGMSIRPGVPLVTQTGQVVTAALLWLVTGAKEGGMRASRLDLQAPPLPRATFGRDWIVVWSANGEGEARWRALQWHRGRHRYQAEMLLFVEAYRAGLVGELHFMPGE